MQARPRGLVSFVNINSYRKDGGKEKKKEVEILAPFLAVFRTFTLGVPFTRKVSFLVGFGEKTFEFVEPRRLGFLPHTTGAIYDTIKPSRRSGVFKKTEFSVCRYSAFPQTRIRTRIRFEPEVSFWDGRTKKPWETPPESIGILISDRDSGAWSELWYIHTLVVGFPDWPIGHGPRPGGTGAPGVVAGALTGWSDAPPWSV